MSFDHFKAVNFGLCDRRRGAMDQFVSLCDTDQRLPRRHAASRRAGFLHALDQSNVWRLSGHSANRVRISAYSHRKLAAGQCFRWPV